MTIFEWKFCHVDRKWIYTACTRATQISDVSFFEYEGSKEDETILTAFLQRKVERYKIKDLKANPSIDDDNYITVEWLKSAYGSCCNSCGDCLTYSIENNMVESNLIAQRIDNGLAHELDNILPCCKWCNCAPSNKE